MKINTDQTFKISLNNNVSHDWNICIFAAMMIVCLAFFWLCFYRIYEFHNDLIDFFFTQIQKKNYFYLKLFLFVFAAFKNSKILNEL
jgi:hypothetical protein